jgi:hypothetical protein
MYTSRSEQAVNCLVNERKFIVTLGICLLSFGSLVILIMDTENFNNSLSLLNRANISDVHWPRAQYSTKQSHSQHGSFLPSAPIKALAENVSES